MPKAYYYAVKKGRVPGIYETWDECQDQVKGFSGPVYKKFGDLESAQQWLQAAKAASPATPVSPDKTPAARRTATPPVVASSSTAVASNPANVASTSAIMLPSVFSATPSAPPNQSDRDIVYTDGSCRGNGKAGSFAGVGVWWGRNDSRNIAERCPGVQTNNRAELIALIRIMETHRDLSRQLVIKTDSQYSINCVEDWLPKWKRNNFRTSGGTPVKNLGLIRYLSALLDVRERVGRKVILQHVYGHQGEEGNEGADALANQGGLLPEIEEPDWDARRTQLEMDAQPKPAARPLPIAAAVPKAVPPKRAAQKPAVYILQPEEVDMSQFGADMLLSDEDLLEMGRTGNFD